MKLLTLVMMFIVLRKFKKQLQLYVQLQIIRLQLLNVSVLISTLIFAMTLAFGMRQLGDVSKRTCMI